MNNTANVAVLKQPTDILSSAEFTPYELGLLLGGRQPGARSKFNRVASFLINEVGFFEEEVPNWFRDEYDSLGGRSPLEVWSAEDGVKRVFDQARIFKAQVYENLLKDQKKTV